MELFDSLGHWMLDHPTATSIGKYLLWVSLISFLIVLLKRFFHDKLPDTSLRYKSQKGIEILGYFLIIIVSISFFTGNMKDFGLAIGFLTAGITITLQELILSIAGSFYIFFVRVYKPGDRIQMHGIKGDVIDIDSMYTTMMEIGEWVSSDNYSGRLVKLSNAFVFKGPVYNYSQDFPFVWDEFDIPIRYGSDVELAKSLIMDIASNLLSDYVDKSRKQWKEVVNKYYIEDAEVDPTIAITMTDNWITFNVRYIVDYKRRRITKHRLNEAIVLQILATNGKVQLGSSTFEIVKIPVIETDHRHKTSNE